MTDRPIIFSAAMIRALLDSRKTQTRRLATSPLRRCAVGDRLYVRERCWIWGHWRKDGLNKAGRQRWRFVPHADQLVTFDPNHADIATNSTPRESSAFWSRPSIHMPRWASRLTLIVERVRVERLNDCSDADAIAEGVVFDSPERGFMVPGVDHPMKDFPYLSRPTAREMYAALWDIIHGSGEWLGNPWVVALTFRVVRGNIDQVPA